MWQTANVKTDHYRLALLNLKNAQARKKGCKCLRIQWVYLFTFKNEPITNPRSRALVFTFFTLNILHPHPHSHSPSPPPRTWCRHLQWSAGTLSHTVTWCPLPWLLVCPFCYDKSPQTQRLRATWVYYLAVLSGSFWNRAPET